jgi:hypothetical protein
MKIKEKLYKEKCLKRKATGIHSKVHEIKPNYSLRFAFNMEAWLWLYRKRFGLDPKQKRYLYPSLGFLSS